MDHRRMMCGAACLAALLALSVSTVSAQEAPAATDAFLPVLTDPAGDVQYLVAETQGTPTTPISGHERGDLISLEIAETQDAMVFRATVTDMEQFPPGSGRWIDAARIDVRFWLGGLHYGVSTGTFDDGVPYGELRGGRPDHSEPDINGDLPVEMDGGTFTVTVPRDLMRDHNGAPAQTGMQLTDLHVDTHVHATGLFLTQADGSLFQPLGIRDRMPDTGNATFDVALGGPLTTAGIGMDTPAPFRASNGGAATIAYPFTIYNEGTDGPFEVQVVGADTQWTIEHEPFILVPGGGSINSTVLVTTPFGHQHGGTAEFTLLVTRADDSSVRAEATMGILYLEIPQPAGHHDTVYLHSIATGATPGAEEAIQLLGFSSGRLWMNTMQEDPQDADGTIPALNADGGPSPTGTDWVWYICLDPHLQLGLDFDLTQTGLLSAPLSSQAPATGVASMELLHIGPGNRITTCLPGAWSGRDVTLVASGSAPGAAIDAGHTFEIPVTATPEGDRVPYATGTDLVLVLRFTADEPVVSGIGPRLEPGGAMQLPLLEYEDERPAGLVSVPPTDPDGRARGNVTGDADLGAEKDTPVGPLAPLGIAVGFVLRRRPQPSRQAAGPVAMPAVQ